MNSLGDPRCIAHCGCPGGRAARDGHPGKTVAIPAPVSEPADLPGMRCAPESAVVSFFDTGAAMTPGSGLATAVRIPARPVLPGAVQERTCHRARARRNGGTLATSGARETTMPQDRLGNEFAPDVPYARVGRPPLTRSPRRVDDEARSSGGPARAGSVPLERDRLRRAASPRRGEPRRPGGGGHRAHRGGGPRCERAARALLRAGPRATPGGPAHRGQGLQRRGGARTTYGSPGGERRHPAGQVQRPGVGRGQHRRPGAGPALRLHRRSIRDRSREPAPSAAAFSSPACAAMGAPARARSRRRKAPRTRVVSRVPCRGLPSIRRSMVGGSRGSSATSG